MGEPACRYDAQVAPDGAIVSLVEQAGGRVRSIPPESPEGQGILWAGREILYRFDEERRLRNLPYPEVLEAMRQEVGLALHKARHGELADEPEALPALRRLLADIQVRLTAAREMQGGGRAAP